VLGTDPNDETGERRLVRVAKTNYKEPDGGLQFRIADDPEFECGYLTALYRDDTAAEVIVGAPVSIEEKGERAEARDILRTLLADGPMDADEAIKASGINAASLKRPRKDIGVIAEARRNMLGRVVGWTWRLPEDQRYNPTRLTVGCTPGSSGHTQDKYTVSAPGEQASESGPLDFGALL
jgi:hypothetical protein